MTFLKELRDSKTVVHVVNDFFAPTNGSDASAAIQAAIDTVEPFNGTIVFPADQTFSVSSTLVANAAIQWVVEGYGDEGANPDSLPSKPTLKWIGSDNGGPVVDITPVNTATETIVYGSIDGLSIDGNNLATIGIRIRNSKDMQIRSLYCFACKTTGFVFENKSTTATAVGPIIDTYLYDCLANAATQGSTGLLVQADTGSAGTVDMTADKIHVRSGPSGKGVVLGDSDDGTINNLTFLTRGGSAPWTTGLGGDALFFRGLTTPGFTQQSRVAQNHTIQRVTGGNIVAKTGTFGNRILSASSNKVNVYVEPGAVLHYNVSDRLGNGDYKTAHEFFLEDSFFVAATRFKGEAPYEPEEATREIVSGVSSPSLEYDSTLRQSASAIVLPRHWNSGEIGSLILHTVWLGEGDPAGSDVRWDVSLATSGVDATGAFVAQTISSTRIHTATFGQAQTFLFTLGTTLNYNRGSLIAITVARDPAHASDNNTRFLNLLGVTINFRGDGPDADVNQVYQTADNYI